jgi:hypothetical protein
VDGCILAAGLAVLPACARGRLAALDRRFFRDQYNAHRLLRGLTEEIRSSDQFDPIAPRVVVRVSAALHVAVVSLLVRRGGEDVYRPVATCPENAKVPVLQAASRTVRLLQLLQTPMESRRDGQDRPPAAARGARDATDRSNCSSRQLNMVFWCVVGFGISVEERAREDEDLLALADSSSRLPHTRVVD